MSYVNVDIDIDDFLSSCGSYDIKEIIEYLVEEGHISETAIIKKSKYQATPGEKLHMEYCQKIADKYFQMSNEDTALIEELAKKYG
jgi:predicted house-cleaning noncanonical NTP pyrophosphatase (MazG superfamily)